MPPLGSTKKADRDCLVCGAVTNTAHMGIDVCRACTVFYRRSNGKKAYACRSSTNKCRAGRGLNCKRCRLLQLEKILHQSGACESSPPITSPCGPPSIGSISNETEALKSKEVVMHQMQPSTSSTPSLAEERARPLLSRIRIAYEKMSYARLMGELFSRKDQPPPMKINSRNHPVYPATFGSMNHANRLLMSCIMEFGSSSFPEFDDLEEEEKWRLAVKFFYSFRMFDNSYRAMRAFPDNKERGFGNYTLWLSEDVVDNFFDDFNGSTGDIEEAKRILRHNCRTKPQLGRAIIDRFEPDEEEFLAVLCLMFWATNGLTVSDEIQGLTESYRRQLFSELHSYYKDVLSLDDYAARMGELCMFLPIFEHHKSVKETFEVFRLLDIFNDDSFTYQLGKS